MKILIRFIVLLALLGLTGCGTLEPVATVGASATAIGKSYGTVVKANYTNCLEEKIELSMVGNEKWILKDEKVKNEEKCKLIFGYGDKKDESQEITYLDFGNLVAAYGQTLSKLAGVKPGALSKDIGNFEKSIAKFKNSSGGSAVDKSDLAAASKIATLITEVVVGVRTRAVAKETIKEADKPLKVIVEKMQAVAKDGIVLTNSREALTDGVRTKVVENSTRGGSGWAYRLLQSSVDEKISKIKADSKLMTKFNEAADKFLIAHGNLEKNWDELTKKNDPKQFDELFATIHELYEAIDKIN